MDTSRLSIGQPKQDVHANAETCAEYGVIPRYTVYAIDAFPRHAQVTVAGLTI